MLFAQIKSLGILATRFDDQAHVRVFEGCKVWIVLERVSRHGVRVIARLHGFKAAHCPFYAALIGAFWHRKHEAVGLDELAFDLIDECAGVLPVLLSRTSSSLHRVTRPSCFSSSISPFLET